MIAHGGGREDQTGESAGESPGAPIRLVPPQVTTVRHPNFGLAVPAPALAA